MAACECLLRGQDGAGAPLQGWQWGGPQALFSLPVMKAKTHFQADPVSRDAARSFAEGPEEQKEGAAGAGSSCGFCRELGGAVVG